MPKQLNRLLTYFVRQEHQVLLERIAPAKFCIPHRIRIQIFCTQEEVKVSRGFSIPPRRAVRSCEETVPAERRRSNARSLKSTQIRLRSRYRRLLGIDALAPFAFQAVLSQREKAKPITAEGNRCPASRAAVANTQERTELRE